ncbi:MAG: GNAT family N-acetyltransferase [Oscillospiraceae bacterium]|jgi:putative acetyltransferase|nr:GNAT family N-acetyltransferase [Oscillospiraceae bacterium]
MIGKGYGKKLAAFAIKKFSADFVDVNEQNIKAAEFYRRMGLIVYKRTGKDGKGKNYPLLKMKLQYQ